MATKNLLIRGGADFSGIKREMDKTQKTISNFQGNISKTFMKIGGILAGAFAVKKIYDYGKASVQTFNAVSVEAAKLAQVMRNTMGATDAQIESVKRLTQAQEGIGVIAWDTQMAGAQELGTYLGNVESLKTLIPTLNDMLAQQYGVDATNEQATNIGMMIGKVMDGQLGALSRYGYSWDAAQEKVLKFGTELERANMLAQVIGQSVGGMNEQLAKTPAGQLKQLEFTFAGIREQIGKGLTPVITTVLPYIQKLANWLAKLAGYFSAFMQAFFGIAAPQVQVGAAISGAADAADSYGDATEGAGKKVKKAAKEAKGSLAGFDEINSLADTSAADGDSGGDVGAGGIGGGGLGGLGDFSMPEIDTETIPAKIQAMADRIKGTFKDMWSGLKDTSSLFKDAFSGIGTALQPIYDAVKPIKQSFRDMGETFLQLNDEFLKPAAEYILFDFIPSIVTGFVKDFAPVFADVAVWSMDLLSETFKNVTADLTSLWNSIWLPSLEKLKGAWLEMSSSTAKSLQKLLDGTIKPLVDYVINDFILPISKKIHEVLVPIFTDILVFAFKEAAKTFEWAANLMNDIYRTVIEPVFELIKKIVMDTLQIVQNLWDKHGQRLLTNLSELMDGVRDLFQQLWDVVLKPIIEPFLEMLTWLWDKHLKNLIEQIGHFIMKLVNGALEIWNKFIKPLIGWIVDDLGPAFVVGFNFVVDVLSSSVAFIADIFAGLFEILGGLIDFIVGVFTGDWAKAWEGVKSIFKGVFDSLWAIVKFPLNLIIDGINAVIGALNTISIDIPSWVPFYGGETFGISIPRIPKLARGGIVDGATNFGNYIAGEAGAEMIVPLENTSFVDKLASALGTAVMSAMQMGSSNSQSDNGDIAINIDGSTLARIINPYLAKENKRIGSTIIQQN